MLLEKIFAFVFILVGLSHSLQPGVWVDFFVWLRSKTYGAFIVVMYTLPIGLVIVAFHNQWQWRPAVILTIAGWIMIIKSAIYAVYPVAFTRTATKGFSSRNSVIAGTVIITCGLLLLTDVYLL